MKIGLDFDGVIADTGKLKSVLAKKLYGLELSSARFKKEFVIKKKLLSLEKYRELQDVIYGNKKMIDLMEPVEDALYFIDRLIREGHSILVITSREKASLEMAKKWLEKCRLSDKSGVSLIGVGIKNTKVRAAKGLDVYLDDDFDKLEPLVKVVPHLFLFSWSFNQHIDEKNVALRITNWRDFYSKVKQIDKS